LITQGIFNIHSDALKSSVSGILKQDGGGIGAFGLCRTIVA
jgi:hypothetical protein